MSSTLLLGGGAIGAAAFVVTMLVDGATRPGYRPRYHPVSALALGSRGWIQTANFIVCGTLIAASSIGIHRADASPFIAVAIALFGVGMFVAGLVPMDPMRGYPPGTPTGTPATTSRRHQIHDWASIAAFGSLALAAGIAALTFDSTGWAIYSALTAVAFVGNFIVFGVAWERDHPLAGLTQRTTIVIGWTWLATTSWHLST